ncbi:hypothetical protein [Schleiferilactobacillus harbinensis]|uniref:hypothetical protein n=1 Tax=Schleiferilactobacillus harbinensis TaxID=304207 RepID=UPI001FB8B3F7|nr:hypothetical protein [Schleiferilactobacillus harbinensis]
MIMVVRQSIVKQQQQLLKQRRRAKLKQRLTKTDANELFKGLHTAVDEKDVENAWRYIFKRYFITKDKTHTMAFTSPYQTDGFIAADEAGTLIFALRLLMEFKDGTDLTKRHDRARIMAQVVHYMHMFKKDGKNLPTVIVGADENQAFTVMASNFYKFVDRDYNWGVAPSSAWLKDPELMLDLQDDANLAVYPFKFDASSANDRYESLLDLFDAIESMTQENGSKVYKVPVSPATILGIFDEYYRIAFPRPEEVSADQAVNLFLQMLIPQGQSSDYYFMPTNRNLFHLPHDKKVPVNGRDLETFFNHYDRNLSPTEIDKLKEIADRLIEAETRRFKGDFWTPPIWSYRADELLQQAFGRDYKETSLVWDCAAGVRNLTRDFHYKDLYISTYHESEIYLGDGYNPEAQAAFQYDFLNDDVDLGAADVAEPVKWKLPKKLLIALKEASKTGKRVIFYTNPPYGTATEVKADGSAKAGISVNKMNILMKADGYGKSAQQLYAQFFVRILKIIDDFRLTNVGIGFFTKPRFFAGGDYWKDFNDRFFARFHLVYGNMFTSNEFSDTAGNWPVTFSVYALNDSQKDKTDSSDMQVTLSVEETALKNSTDKKVVIKQIAIHQMRCIYKPKALSNWARASIQDAPEMTAPYPQLSSAMSVSKGQSPRGRLVVGSLGYMVSNSNNVGEGINNGGVWIVTGSAYKANGFNVMPSNFDRAVVNFAARRSPDATWVNDQDNYLYPNTKGSLYLEFVNDALIYSLFDNASYQAAYRDSRWSNTTVPGRWANQWFWLSKDKVIEAADAYSLAEVYQDTRGDTDRFVSRKIQKVKDELSPEALNVLNAATQVWYDTLPYREAMNEDEPSLYLTAWDAGWFQVKKVNDKYPSKHYREFRDAFKKLKAKTATATYDLGMLLH